ncbi:hypothetical protein LTR22_015394 [Elasticomyces elasticus]|nr:hypothetical protein LTR22_015394 [Elasticomyces elasticus]KAK4921996.1 hypothetical protein LTR49_010581 [Elasticomyces elasticus]
MRTPSLLLFLQAFVAVTTFTAAVLSEGVLGSTDVGEYVAHGLGLTTSILGTPSQDLISSSTQTRVLVGQEKLASGVHEDDSSTATSVAPSGNVFSNTTTNSTDAGQCWREWEEYWQASSELFSTWYFDSDQSTTETLTVTAFGTKATMVTATSTQYAGTIPIKTDVFTESGNDMTLETLTSISAQETSVSAIYSGYHTEAYSTNTWTSYEYGYSSASGTDTLVTGPSTTRTIKANTVADFATATSVVVDLYNTTVYTAVTAGPGVTTPPCVLPSSVPQCQSQWEKWVDTQMYGLSTPDCVQARVTGDFCDHLTSSYMTSAQYDGLRGSMWRYYTNASVTSSSKYWPATSELAPKCTLGCQVCRITGDKVELLYWPPATTSGNAARSDARIAVTLGTTFTSPTGRTFTDKVIAITDTASFSSIYGSVHQADLAGFDVSLRTAAFNFSDLTPPVPYNIYTSQPRCATEIALARGASLDSEHFQETGTTIVTTCDSSPSYRPLIAIPAEVRDLDPSWGSCEGGLNGAYDPPVHLTATDVAAGPTIPTISAMPASTFASPASNITAQIRSVLTPTSPSQPASSTSAAKGAEPCHIGLSLAMLLLASCALG